MSHSKFGSFLLCTLSSWFMLVSSQTQLSIINTTSYGDSQFISPRWRLDGAYPVESRGSVVFTVSTIDYDNIKLQYACSGNLGTYDRCEIQYRYTGTSSYSLLRSIFGELGRTITLTLPAVTSNKATLDIRMYANADSPINNCYFTFYSITGSYITTLGMHIHNK